MLRTIFAFMKFQLFCLALILHILFNFVISINSALYKIFSMLPIFAFATPASFAKSLRLNSFSGNSNSISATFCIPVSLYYVCYKEELISLTEFPSFPFLRLAFLDSRAPKEEVLFFRYYENILQRIPCVFTHSH